MLWRPHRPQFNNYRYEIKLTPPSTCADVTKSRYQLLQKQTLKHDSQETKHPWFPSPLNQFPNPNFTITHQAKVKNLIPTPTIEPNPQYNIQHSQIRKLITNNNCFISVVIQFKPNSFTRIQTCLASPPKNLLSPSRTFPNSISAANHRLTYRPNDS